MISYSILKSNNGNIWNKIEEYIIKMNLYYNNNRLQMNTMKTKVMIISNNNEDLENSIKIKDHTIKNSNNITVLGTVINNKLNWNSHVLDGKGLLYQLKQRLNSIRLISKYISQNFAKQIANAILI